MNWLLRLYPRAWQRRYRGELEAYLRSEPRDFDTVLDLIKGAMDAWLNPRWIPHSTQAEGEQPMIRLSRCGSAALLTDEKLHSSGWMIAVCLGLTLLYFALLSMFGHHVMIQALLYAAFPIAYTMAARRTSPKPYSHVFRYVGVVAWYAFFLAVTSLSALV